VLPHETKRRLFVIADRRPRLDKLLCWRGERLCEVPSRRRARAVAFDLAMIFPYI
jgi:hypothetical protein